MACGTFFGLGSRHVRTFLDLYSITRAADRAAATTARAVAV